MVTLRRKIHILQKNSANKLLQSFKRTVDFERKDSEYTRAASSEITNSVHALLVQPNSIELELRRNTAVMYANMIPPR